jgi:hypothetical protein
LRLQLLQEQQEDAIALAPLHRQGGARRRRRRRRFWVRPWIQRRMIFGNYDNLMVELAQEAEGDFANFMRMEPRMFRELLERVSPRLQQRETNIRHPLEPGLKLAITLQYIASGNSYHSRCTISKVVKEVCEAIIEELEEEVFKFPTTPEEWQQIAGIFGTRWNFHHTCGALDAKHIAIKVPINSTS